MVKKESILIYFVILLEDVFIIILKLDIVEVKSLLRTGVDLKEK